MPCEVCGYENPAANNFCGSCGVPLKQSAPARQKDPIAVQQTGKQKDRARVKGKREEGSKRNTRGLAIGESWVWSLASW